MKFFNNLKAEMKAIQKLVVEMKKIECTNTIKQVKLLFNEFGFTVRVLKGTLVGGRNI